MISFLIESQLLGLLGGIAGGLSILPLNLITTGVGNFASVSETTFNFHVGPEVMVIGVVFSLLIAAIGGLFPARMAAKKEILVALRGI